MCGGNFGALDGVATRPEFSHNLPLPPISLTESSLTHLPSKSNKHRPTLTLPLPFHPKSVTLGPPFSFHHPFFRDVLWLTTYPPSPAFTMIRIPIPTFLVPAAQPVAPPAVVVDEPKAAEVETAEPAPAPAPAVTTESEPVKDEVSGLS